jgi:saccharopine dehydrogenase-like NADP-dependent oxidoreductase
MKFKPVEGVEKGNFVHVDQWDNGEVWLNVQVRGASASCILNREGAEALIEALKAVLAEEVAA